MGPGTMEVDRIVKPLGNQTMVSLDRITSDPAVMNGQPCIRGMRLTVRRVLDTLLNQRNMIWLQARLSP